MKTELTKRNSYEIFGVVVTVAIITSALLSEFFGSCKMGSFVFWLKQTLYTVIVGAVGVVYCNAYGNNVTATLKIRTKPNGRQLLVAMCAVFFLINFFAEINKLLEDFYVYVGLNKPTVSLPDTTGEQLFGYLLCACVLPAICEETVFRGVIANGLMTSLGRIKGALVSGVLFALFHMNPAQTLYQFVFGTVLALVYYDSGSLWASVLLHLFNNVLAVTFAYTLEKTGFYSDNFAVVLFTGGVMAAFFLWKYLRLTRNNATVQIAEEKTNKTSRTQSGKTPYVFLAVGIAVCVGLWIQRLFS